MIARVGGVSYTIFNFISETVIVTTKNADMLGYIKWVYIFVIIQSKQLSEEQIYSPIIALLNVII